MDGQIATPDSDFAPLPTPLDSVDDEESPAVDWRSASDLADCLDVTVLHIRELAEQGEIEQLQDGSHALYRVGSSSDERENTSCSLRSSHSATTSPGGPADTGEIALDDSDDSHKPEEKRLSDGTIVVEPEDIEYLTMEELVPTELLATNRELMRLVDGVLARWTEASSARQTRSEDVKDALREALQVQQCLSHWQLHAEHLSKQVLVASHVVGRALDLADEALSRRWTSGKRRELLLERLSDLKQQVESV